MKNVRRDLATLASMAALAALSSGCMSSAVRTDGFVGWNYRSAVAQTDAQSQTRIPVSIQIESLDHGPASVDMGMPGGILRVVPILSLISSPFVYVNSVPDGKSLGLTEIRLKTNELEGILAGEITKADLFEKATVGGTDGDFLIKGDVALRFEMQRHFSGLGILYIALLPALLLPADAETFKCEAHFEIVSTRSNTTVLSKDYVAKSRWQCWIYNQPRIWESYGDEVFPKIVDSLLADMKALPRSAWDQ